MSENEITQSSGDVFADLNVSRTPSKDRAEAHIAAARMVAHLWLRDDRTSLGTKMAMANCDVLAEHIAAALATSFAEGMKRAAEIARTFDDRTDILKISGWGVSKAIRSEAERR